MAYDEFWHGSGAPHKVLAPGLDGGIHLGTRAQAEMRAAAFLHKCSYDPGRVRRGKDHGGGWGPRIASARQDGYASIVYLNRWEGMSPQDAERAAALGNADRLSDARWRREFPDCRDSLIALHPEDVRVVDIIPGPGFVTLWHGTTEENAADLLSSGFSPETWRRGGNCGSRGLLYLTTEPEDARWFSNERGSDVVLRMRVRAQDLIVDPEDGIGATVAEEMTSGLPGKLATRAPIPPHRISALALRAEPGLITPGL